MSGAGVEKKGGEWSEEDEAEFKANATKQYEQEGHPFYAR